MSSENCNHEWISRKDDDEMFDCLHCQAVAQLTIIWEHDAECNFLGHWEEPCNCLSGKDGSKP